MQKTAGAAAPAAAAAAAVASPPPVSGGTAEGAVASGAATEETGTAVSGGAVGVGGPAAAVEKDKGGAQDMEVDDDGKNDAEKTGPTAAVKVEGQGEGGGSADAAATTAAEAGEAEAKTENGVEAPAGPSYEKVMEWDDERHALELKVRWGWVGLGWVGSSRDNCTSCCGLVAAVYRYVSFYLIALWPAQRAKGASGC